MTYISIIVDLAGIEPRHIPDSKSGDFTNLSREAIVQVTGIEPAKPLLTDWA